MHCQLVRLRLFDSLNSETCKLLEVDAKHAQDINQLKEKITAALQMDGTCRISHSDNLIQIYPMNNSDQIISTSADLQVVTDCSLGSNGNHNNAIWENNRSIVCLDVLITQKHQNYNEGNSASQDERAVLGGMSCGAVDDMEEEDGGEELKPKDVIEILNDINLYVSTRDVSPVKSWVSKEKNLISLSNLSEAEKSSQSRFNKVLQKQK
ncbi:hypothetical protein BDR26DRAFT_860447 [Obelidium mucronatum]|nr:hypothetical protein BDR26DRAFT_860447 [Obelidium mucronatum]